MDATARMTAHKRLGRIGSVPRTTAWGLSLALLTALISGVSVWLNSFGVREVPDAALYTTLKNGVAAMLLVGALMASTGGPVAVRSLERGAWARLALIGLIGGSIPFLLFFTGLAQASAPGAAFIHKTMFVWVALLAVPFLGERLGGLQIGAIALLLAGQVLLAPPRVDGAQWGSGETLIAMATLLWSVEVVLAKRLLRSVPPLVVGAGRLGIGLLVLIAFAVVSGSADGLASVSMAGWTWVIVTGVLLAGYVGSWMAALSRAPASAVTSVLVLGAVITAGIQAVAVGATPAPTVLAGGLVLLGAVAVVLVGAIRGAARGRSARPVPADA
jgi:drug/metabolite transporter (DMT)-like permease